MKGFELSTFGTTNRRSNQLSYIRHTHKTLTLWLKTIQKSSDFLTFL